MNRIERSGSTLLMIRPVGFRMNEQTAVNNYYQQDIDMSADAINTRAQKEFDLFVGRLRAAGVQVIAVEDLESRDTPDAIFPNNWVSFHQEGTVVLYPMFAPNRRKERREDILDLIEEAGFVINEIIDYTEAEEYDIFLEGTGSIVLDHQNKKAFCALSPRADEELFIEFCEDFEMDPVLFTANQTVDGVRLPIYHTNVMMCIGDRFAVVCLNSIDDPKERKEVKRHLKEGGKEIIEISEFQLTQFAGNMLQVYGDQGQSIIVMSEAAYKSLNEEQRTQFSKYGTLLYSPLDTIETCGGGSARCMMAEVHLPRSKS